MLPPVFLRVLTPSKGSVYLRIIDEVVEGSAPNFDEEGVERILLDDLRKVSVGLFLFHQFSIEIAARESFWGLYAFMKSNL